jgi:heme/copper-type cytochrome/quinol oxidase subunit 3
VELGHLGRGEGGKEHGRAARVGPNMAQPRGGSLFLFSDFYFFSFLFLFYFYFFLFLFPLNQKFSK